ncbi:unnamed protein product [Sphagnum troendelagicum]|uniref:Ribosomal protein S14 n=1 Tax=Sphagnum troendelagicum TaxID=128251 RepID=A0ABP0U8K5_9BRYO
MQALSGLMSCRKVGLRESSSSWRNRSNGRHLLERCAQQENIPQFFLKGHGRQSYVPLTCQA